MSEPILEYERFFRPDQSIRIILGADQPRQPEIYGTICGLYRDLVELVLDEEWTGKTSAVSEGELLELRSARELHPFRCRALLVGSISEPIVSLRLVGNVIFDELREFFRIDTYLPLRYTPLPDLDEKGARIRWLEIYDLHECENEGFSEFIHRTNPNVTLLPEAEIDIGYRTPVAANISGGGLRTSLPEELEDGSHAILELYLPGHEPRIVTVGGVVLSSSYVQTQQGRYAYATSFRFAFITEQDRDHLIGHIQKVQQRQIREMSEEMPSLKRALDQIAAQKAARQLPPVVMIMMKAAAITLAVIIVALLANHYRNPGKSEIHRIFEEGIRDYIKQLKPSSP